MIAQSVYCLAAGWTFRVSNPGGGGPRFSSPFQTSPGAHPASCAIGTGSFPGTEGGGEAETGGVLTLHPACCAEAEERVRYLPTVVRRNVRSKNVVNEEALAHCGAVAPKTHTKKMPFGKSFTAVHSLAYHIL